MELDQILFKKFTSFINKIKNKPSQEEELKTVYLNDCRNELTILAQLLTGKPIKIITAEREGGWKDLCFYLPEKLYLLTHKTDNEKLYWFRVFYMATLFNNYFKLETPDETKTIDIKSTLHRQAINFLIEEFPPFEDIYQNLLAQFSSIAKEEENKETDYSFLLGKWMMQPENKETEISKDIANKQYKKQAAITTEIKAKPVDEVTSIQVDKKAQEDFVLTHNFEKVETAEEFNGVWRDFDGADDLQEHSEALDDITMRHTVRVDEDTHSVYQSEYVSNAYIPESKDVVEEGTKCFVYDEWDAKKQQYKPNYCKVFVKRCMAKNTSDYYQQTIQNNAIILRSMRKQFASFFNKLKTIKRLNQGDLLNMDAVTDVIIDQKSGHTPSDKVYDAKRKRKKDLAILFLLDLSLSSDAYTGGNRIIDIEKQIAIIMGEVLNEYHIPFQIDGFFSKTRNNCSYLHFVKFNEDWNRKKANIGTAIPEAYTRIGPALRHAKTEIEKQDARSKWVVILSDGKPNDYDKYEGKHGISDIRQALRELEQASIHTFAFAIDERAKFSLPLIFGQSNYQVLSNPKEMLESMSIFCQKIIA